MTIQCEYISLMRRQFIINQHLASAGFVQNGYLYTVTESSQLIYQDYIYIFNEGIAPYFIVSNVVLDILNATVIPHRYIMQCCITQSRVFLHTSRQCKF